MHPGQSKMHPTSTAGCIGIKINVISQRQKNAVPLRFRGFRKSRENCASTASFFLSKSEASRGASGLV